MNVHSNPTPAFQMAMTADAAGWQPADVPLSADAAVADSGAAARQAGVMLFQSQFGRLARSPRAFHAAMTKVYGAGYDKAKAERFRQRALAGDYSWLPKTKFVAAENMGGALGAYDAKSNTIFLNETLEGHPKLAASTFVEEAGHALDAQLNVNDTPGDEGALFRRVMAGEQVGSADVAALRAENDHGTINVNGRRINVEQRSFFKKITRGIKNVFGGVKKAGKAVVGAVKNVGKQVFSSVSKVGTSILGGAKKVLGRVFKGLKSIAGPLLDGTKKIAGPILQGAKKVLGRVFAGIKKVAGPLLKVLKPALKVLGKVLPKVLKIAGVAFPPAAIAGVVLGVVSKVVTVGAIASKLLGLGKTSGMLGGLAKRVASCELQIQLPQWLATNRPSPAATCNAHLR